MTSLPLTTHPIVLAAADEMAQEFHDAIGEVMPDDEAGECHCAWEDEASNYRATRIAAHARLLCDLSRAASADWWARWLAATVGLTVGATAPSWRRSEPYWVLGAGPQVEDGEEWDGELDFGPTPSGNWPKRQVPALATLTNPAEALAAAVLVAMAAS